MLQIDYVLETLAPLCFTEQSGDNVLYETKQYIPGGSLRGALAAAYIRAHGVKDAHKDPLFRKLFLTGQVRYLSAYPQAAAGGATIPMPLSVMASKDGKTIIDFSYGIAAKAGFKKLSGFACVDTQKRTLTSVAANTQIDFHMSRAQENERISGKSVEGNVFNYEYLEPYQKFTGKIIVDDSCADAVAELKQLLQESLHLGRSRSAQYGTCSCTILQEHDIVLAKKVPEKIVLLAYSAYIPEDGWKRIDDLAEELACELNDALEAGGSAVRLSCSGTNIFAAAECIDGFVGVWGLKRQRVNALAAGSLLELQADGMDSVAFELLQTRLLAGCGARTAEGYGHFILWSPLEEGYKKQDNSQELHNKTDLAAVRDAALAILQKRVLEEIRNQAQQDAFSMVISDKGKGTLKRIEAWTDSSLSKSDILAKLNDLGKAAQENLKGMRLAGKSVWNMLMEKDNNVQPYADIDWLTRLGLNKKQAMELQKDLGFTSPVSDEALFKEYWLWFARHGVKSINKQYRDKDTAFMLANRIKNQDKEA